ncbi:TRAP transporter substrate-binding protein DctP [Aquicoccus sp. SU-CL01552]|uniref:TRAP transporter substrate-binding protein DctP n=1 Tax=Aquicoccus sp. SU-CL01552 TaxID=3127656 RepID=UPI00310244DA
MGSFSKRLAAAVCATALFGSIAAAQDVTLKLATDSGARGSSVGDAMEKWAQMIEEGTNGEVDVEIFYQNELGGQQEVFDLFMANDVNLMINWPMTSYDGRIAAIYTPYMFKDWEDALAAYGEGGWMNGVLGGIYTDLGLKFFGAWPEGFNGVATKGGYASTIEEAAKFKIRVPPVTPMAETIDALGYQTATIDWGELFTAIQTGVVDGDGANVIYWDYEYFRDTLDYYTALGQQFNTGIISMNLEAWDSLTPEQQEVIASSSQEIMKIGFDGAKALDQSYVDAAKAAGMEYIELPEETIAEFAAVVREKVWPVMEDKLGAEIMQAIRDNASEF